jgi:leucyl-tRNA synthetase
VKCPKCGSHAKRDPDTMDTFVDSSWYYLRFLNPNITDAIFDKDKAEKWIPVDMYVGGAEHATMHLLYARFIHKFIRDLGLINSDEPFTKLLHQGTITNRGVKMSKSKENVVNPDDFTSKVGADIFRLYLMFMGPFEMGGDWSDQGISGTERFVNRVYDLFEEHKYILNEVNPANEYDLNSLTEQEKFVYRKTNQAIHKVDEELEHFRFNTAIAALMELLNNLKDLSACSKEIQAYVLSRFAVILAPLAPHLGEECYNILGNDNSLFENPVWFKADEKALIEDSINIAVQVNGKLRTTLELPIDSEEDTVKKAAFNHEKITKHTSGKNIVKEIYVKNKIYNIVAK